MKKLLVLSIALFVACVSHGTIHIVNNTVGQDADFNSLSAAITAATAGDSIYVQPSATTYGDIVINKQLFILGAGHNPEFSNYASTLGVVTFQSGSSGTILKGFAIFMLVGTIYNTSNDVVISGCWVNAQNPTYFSQGTWNNWTFEGNIFMSQSNGINLSSLGSNIVFRNNILHTFGGSNIVGYCSPGFVFENNIFMCTDNTNFNAALNLSNGVVLRNNIFYTTTTTGTNVANSCNSCTWENNVTYNPNLEFTDLPGTNNLNNTNPDFINVPLLNISFSYAKDYHLNTGSPLIGTASDGGDIGLYGGIYEFRMEGIDNTLPRIINVTPLTATAPPGGVLQVNLKAAAAGN
jgi:hypothetical protein